MALTNDGQPQRGRGQQKQQQVQAGTREASDVIASSGEFGKKSRVQEYYNSQEQQPQQAFRNAGTPNVRIRNQFNQTPSSISKDNTERDNNRITQFGSREQQPQR